MAEHRGYAINKRNDRVTGIHFTAPGHSVSDITITVLEQIESSCNNQMPEDKEQQMIVFSLRNREQYFIDKFDTIEGGLNEQEPRQFQKMWLIS